MKKRMHILLLLLTLIMCMNLGQATAIEELQDGNAQLQSLSDLIGKGSGTSVTVGDWTYFVTYSLDAGTLKVTHLGGKVSRAIKPQTLTDDDWKNAHFPWENQRNSITDVIYGNINSRAHTVSSIYSYALHDCNNLITVVIGKSIKEIKNYAFLGCSNLKDVYYEGTQEQWEAISIGLGNESLINARIHYNSTDIQNEQPVEIDVSHYYALSIKRLFRITPLGDSSFRKPAGFIVSANGETFSSGKEICTSTDDITANIRPVR